VRPTNIEADDLYVGEVILLDPTAAEVVQIPVFARTVRAL